MRSQEAALPFSCAIFGPHMSAADLRVRFGRGNVTSGLVLYGGAEGDYNEGTILFANRPNARLEIYWKDREAKRDPEWIHISGNASRWRSPSGIVLGMDLKAVERLNGRPFRLVGFGSDLQGGVSSWSDGRLARQDVNGCRIGFRFDAPNGDERPDLQVHVRQVGREDIYSSGHPAMQMVNPRIIEAFITYPR